MDPEMPRGGPDAGPAQNEAERTAKHLRGVLDVWQGKEIGAERPVAASPVAEVHETSPEPKMRTGVPRTPTPHLFVSADSKGVISPLFPADPRGACKCGL